MPLYEIRLGGKRRKAMSKRALSRAVLILGAVQLVESLAIALPISFFPNYVISLGASVASVGLFTSSFMIAYAILSPKMGAYVDQYGRKKIMMLGIFSAIKLFSNISEISPIVGLVITIALTLLSFIFIVVIMIKVGKEFYKEFKRDNNTEA